MRKILLIAFGILVAIVLVLVVVIALQPGDFRVVRTATINAPPAAVFAQVNDFHKWNAWSPWAKLDPAAKETFEGPPSGKDAIFKWNGNNEVGEGQMTLEESRPDDLIKIKLDFVRPFQSTCDVEFNFKAQGEQTVVTWSMAGHNNFIAKAFCLFMDMDKTVGGDFEKGLASLKSVVEAKQAEGQ